MNIDGFSGFERLSIDTTPGRVCLRRGGSGPAVLLLHGFPETHLAWRKVAPRLSDRFTVIAADLPGYGDSVAPESAGDDRGASKRAMARQLLVAVEALGIARVAVIGHDRGARVAYRMALDQPDRVTALGIFDVVPALDVAERLTYAAARQMVNWFLLAQPPTLPEDIVNSDPDRYIRSIFESWGGLDAIEPEVVEEYLRCFRNPSVVRAVCAEYRAGDSIDIENDRVDRAAGRRIGCPVLVSWAPGGLVPLFGDPISIWRQWADDVRGEPMPAGGHFVVEESPEQAARLIERLLALTSVPPLSPHASATRSPVR